MNFIKFDPLFIEEAVFLAVNKLTRDNNTSFSKWFYGKRDSIYEKLAGDAREESFHKFYEEAFVNLGLKSLFEGVVLEFPVLKDSGVEVFFKRAWSRKEEGADLYREGVRRIVLFGLQVGRITETELLKAYLRHELMHVSDMLDPAFGYVPHLDLGGATAVENEWIRDRFRLLWDLYVAVRMKQRGQAPFLPLEIQEQEFNRLFTQQKVEERERFLDDIVKGKVFTAEDTPGQPGVSEAVPVRGFRPRAGGRAERGPLTQRSLVDFAREDICSDIATERKGRCSVCQFPSFNLIRLADNGDGRVLEEIRRDRPDWDAQWNLCRQCYELYRARMAVAL